jgi:hypothetical protein
VFGERILEYPAGRSPAFTVAGGHGTGSKANQLSDPLGVAVDAHGDVYVAEWGNQRVQEWTPGAAYGITILDGRVAPADQPFSVVGVAVDGRGDVLIADEAYGRVREWTPGATRGITVAGGNGVGAAANQLRVPDGVAVDSHGGVFVSELVNRRVQKVTLPATPIPTELSTTTLGYYTTTSDDQAPPVRVGHQVVLVATIRPLTGDRPPTGMVDFSDGPVDLGAVAIQSNDATAYGILFTTLAPGTHTIIARYLGDGTYLPSESPLTVTASAG